MTHCLHGFTFFFLYSLYHPISSALPFILYSDYIIKEKTVLLQKKDNEGFGFVLRGAKGGALFQNSHPSVFYQYSCKLLYSSTQALLSKPFSHTFSFAAQTPIEEFTPTPAFPALQYLESVDEGGVAWRAGLRMGDFLIEVRHNISKKHKHPAIKEHISG